MVDVTEHSWRSDYCMSYLHGGSGPPLLMLHGLTAYSFSWRHNIPALVGVAEIFAPDFLGAGNSDRPPRGFDNSMRAIAERMLRFMDAMKIDHADVISTSHG